MDMTRIKAEVDGQMSDSTTAFRVDGAARPVERRKIALIPGSGSCLTDEISCLLRRRLRVAGLIALAGNAYFFFKNLWLAGENPPIPGFGSPLQGIVVALMTVLCALLWTRVALGMRALRAIELGLFGSMAVFFAYVQYSVFAHGAFLEWAVPEHREDVLRLGTATNGLRWFVLIVLYGTFIPNTWRRCATVVGLMALTPLMLSFLTCAGCPIMGPHLGSTTFDQIVILSVGAAIAIFGSYK